MKRYTITALAILSFVALAILVLALVRGLTAEPSVLLGDTSCAPPCWNTIRPGVTTADDVFRLLNGAPEVDPLSLSERNRGDEVVWTSWVFQRPAPDATGRVHYLDGRVAAIVINTFGSVSLEEMLAKLGPASFLWSHCAAGPGMSWPQIVLFWPDDGYALAIDFDLACSDPDVIRLSPGDGVATVTYFEAARFEEILRMDSVFGVGSERAASEWVPWSDSSLAP
jgi:hypothetical protein